MYFYKVVEKHAYDEQDEFILLHEKKYTQDEFEEIVMIARNSLRPFVSGYSLVKELNEKGFKGLKIQAEDEFEAEN